MIRFKVMILSTSVMNMLIISITYQLTIPRLSPYRSLALVLYLELPSNSFFNSISCANLIGDRYCNHLIHTYILLILPMQPPNINIGPYSRLVKLIVTLSSSNMVPISSPNACENMINNMITMTKTLKFSILFSRLAPK